MRRAVFGACMALTMALGSMGWAQTQQPAPSQGRNSPTALDFWMADQDTSDSRKDVAETSRTPPPSGPATLMPYCGPSSIICP